MRTNWTIRQRLLALLLGAVLPLLVALGLGLHFGWRMARAQAGSSGLRIARMVATQTAQVVDDASGALDVLAARTSINDRDDLLSPACREFLAEVLELKPWFDNVLVVDREVRVVAAARTPGTRLLSPLADSDSLRALMATGRRGLSGPIHAQSSDRWVAGLAQPLRDRAGGVLGAVVVSLDLTACQRLAEASARPRGVTTTVIDSRGYVLARAPDPELWVGHGARGVEIVDRTLTDDEGTLVARGLDGVERLYGFTSIPGTSWKVYSGVPTAVAFAPLRAGMRAALVALLATLLVAAAAAFTLGRGIERPVRALVGAIDRIGTAGDAPRVPVAGPPEIERVAQAVNEMLDARVAAERERERLLGQVSRGEAMAAMGALVGTVAHEVRNPLFGITATLDAFEARHGSSEDLRPYLRSIRDESQRLNQLMADLLAYGASGRRGDRGAVTPPAAALEAALDLCRPAATVREVRLCPRIAEPLPLLAIGHDRLVLVLRNLVENAILLAPVGSEVVVTCVAEAHEGMAGAAWSVLDSGPGFPPGETATMFEPFQGHRSGGTGLGLAIVSRTVVDHGGTLAAENRPEGGAAVRFWLPAAADRGPARETP